uniref:Uncharacterized protein n=1 Tax=Molossus molossus TaxID=27622 RepID=A0A7J8GL11_MOLMO|nr:hypothetical protein HJG59_013901 [Molossus molossus]
MEMRVKRGNCKAASTGRRCGQTSGRIPIITRLERVSHKAIRPLLGIQYDSRNTMNEHRKPPEKEINPEKNSVGTNVGWLQLAEPNAPLPTACLRCWPAASSCAYGRRAPRDTPGH